jgi:uncharacterized protein
VGNKLKWLGLAAVVLVAGVYLGKTVLHARALLRPPRRVPILPDRSALPVEEVTFKTADGLALSGWFWPSSSGAAVVLVHGWGETRDRWAKSAEWLHARGIGGLMFDLRAHGASEGDRSTYGDRERADVAAALGWMKTRPGIERVGAMGFSIGALALAGAVEAGERPAAVVLLGADPDLREGLHVDWGRRAQFGIWALEAGGVRVDEVSPRRALLQLQQAPLLLVAGEKEAFPLHREFFRQAGEGRSLILPGVDHGEYEQAAPRLWYEQVLGFLERSLQPVRLDAR